MRSAKLERVPSVLFVSLLGGALVLGLGACIPGKEQLINDAMSSEEQREGAFEASARVLDRHPEYVDDFYRIARRHPGTMRRFLVNATKELENAELADLTAELLAERPRALEQTLVSAVDAARDNPAARAAIATAVERRAGLLMDMITDQRSTVMASLGSTVRAVQRKPQARPAFLAAMQRSAPAIAEILARDPTALAVLTEAVLKVGLSDRQALLATLRRAGIGD